MKQKIGSRYRIQDVLKGGMGLVYICHDSKLGIPVALKTLQGRFMSSKRAQNIFKKEAFVWTQLEKYAYIVRAHGVEILDDMPFIKLEYIRPDSKGRNTLTHYLGHLAIPDMIKIAIKLCYGMKYAYSKGVEAHRDIKPDNVMITKRGTVKITDFGLAKVLQEIPLRRQERVSESSHGLSIFMSRGRRVCGTLPYMAPEQFDGKSDKRSDMYSFGVVLYQMATDGELPFTGNTPLEFEYHHKHTRVRSIFSPLLPIIQKCMRKDPSERYESFFLLKEDLRSFFHKYVGGTFKPARPRKLSPEEMLEKGITMCQLGRHKEGIICYNSILRLNPNDIYAWLSKGRALGKIKKHEEAITCFSEALRIDRRCIEAWRWIGWNLYLQEKSEAALEIYDNAIREDPTFAELWYSKGFLLGRLRRYEEAIDCYHNALAIDAELIGVWHNLGCIFYRLKQYKKAIKCFNKAIAINPKSNKPRRMRELSLRKLKH